MLTSLKEQIKNILEWIRTKNYVSYGTAITITSYNSASNSYTIPKDGIIRLFCWYTSGNYIAINVADADGTNANSFQIMSTGTAHRIIPIPVFKGQKVWVGPNNGSNNAAEYIPFVVGGTP